jgi:cellulose 1,4-beta-cellobiosidase
MHPSVSAARRTIAARVGATAVVLACAIAARPAQAQRVDNPFAGATWYVSPEYAKNVADSAAKVTDDATLRAKVAKVAAYPTAFWMDRIAAINGAGDRMGLAAHLDAALTQQQAGKPVVVIVVIYDLPGRDCSAMASNGELGPTDIERYKTEYIDPIAAIEGNPKYASLRIVNIVELDSLPNIVTNVSGRATPVALCDTMKQNGNYVKGVQYALSKLYAAGSNTYNYIDVGHHGWLGWDSNFGPTAQLLYDTAKGATGGVNTVAGFISNTSNVSALEEPFLKVTNETRQSKWVDWNWYVDEKGYVIAMRDKLVSLGFPSRIGMLIDTSRNGWGGPQRPTAASTASDIDTRVNADRIDKRIHAGNWCNQVGAGIGERPQVVGANGIHAYVWVKPPGESDGASAKIPNDEGKGADPMCDPNFLSKSGLNGNNPNGNPTGAMGGAPLAGHWFHEQFVELVKNAYPPLSADGSSSGGTSSGGTSSGGTSSGGTSSSSGGPGTGDFSLKVSPRSLTLYQGENGSTTILLTKIGSFNGTVDLTASGLPTDVTGSFAPASTTGPATLSLKVAANAATAQSTVVVTGKSGGLTRTDQLYLTIIGKSDPTFTLSPSPSSLTVSRGGCVDFSVAVNGANGFSQSPSLNADGLPDGVTATWNRSCAGATSQGGSGTYTAGHSFTATQQVAPGTYKVSIVGTAGALNRGTTLDLTVLDNGTSSGGGSGSSGSGTSSGGTGSSSGGTSSGGHTSSSGATNPSGGKKSSGGCSSAGVPDVTLTLLGLGGALTLRRRRRA